MCKENMPKCLGFHKILNTFEHIFKCGYKNAPKSSKGYYINCSECICIFDENEPKNLIDPRTGKPFVGTINKIKLPIEDN